MRIYLVLFFKKLYQILSVAAPGDHFEVTVGVCVKLQSPTLIGFKTVPLWQVHRSKTAEGLLYLTTACFQLHQVVKCTDKKGNSFFKYGRHYLKRTPELRSVFPVLPQYWNRVMGCRRSWRLVHIARMQSYTTWPSILSLSFFFSPYQPFLLPPGLSECSQCECVRERSMYPVSKLSINDIR